MHQYNQCIALMCHNWQIQWSKTRWPKLYFDNERTKRACWQLTNEFCINLRLYMFTNCVDDIQLDEYESHTQTHKHNRYENSLTLTCTKWIGISVRFKMVRLYSIYLIVCVRECVLVFYSVDLWLINLPPNE